VPYWAHYDQEKEIKQTLKEHLSSVAAMARDRVSPGVQFKDIPSSIVKELAYWMGYFHDLGKYTDYFQDYLTKNKNSKFKEHAHISACCVYSFLLDRVIDLSDDWQKKITAFLIYLCSRKHHGALSLEGLFSISREKEIWKLLQAAEHNLLEKLPVILQDAGLSDRISGVEFKKYLSVDVLIKSKSLARTGQYLNSGRGEDERWFFLAIYLFSLLIDSDKLDSGGLKSGEVKSCPSDQVSKYLNKKLEQLKDKRNVSLWERRNNARKTMLGIIEGLSDEEIKGTGFFTITAPTGIGKTLSSLQCALCLQERIKVLEKYTPRIIAAIPFINIIEQNKKEYEQVFGKELKLIVHHRLGDFSVQASSREEISVDQALLEVESWEGDVILTTFVQLFQSIITGNNRLLKKFNKLAGSIVILDEAQAVPEYYMPLIGAVLQKMTEFLGTRFILMTATQPKILEFGNLLLGSSGGKAKAVPLLPEFEGYFEKLTRTKFVSLLKKNRLDTGAFLELFQEKWDGKKSVLIVVNTIKRSIEVYREIKKLLKDQACNIPVCYLSTNIMPRQRREVIKNVKDKLENRETVILVSTQTIEAGVDLDFDMAFRDFAPIDSLIQTAGRVNREGRKGEYLPVYIVQLESDNHYVYELTHRHSTMKLLQAADEIKEPQYGRLADEYYTLALARGISNKSKELWQEGIMKLNFEKLKEFQLIQNTGEVVDVFVEDCLKATQLANAYEELLRYKEYDLSCESGALSKVIDKGVIPNCNGKLSVFERKAILRLILAKVSDFIIQVRVSRLKENRPVEFRVRGDVESSMYWIPPGQKKEYYDNETGFISETGEAFIL
jgi:CRISPR-associated endonuclease/helicase Cas3